MATFVSVIISTKKKLSYDTICFNNDIQHYGIRYEFLLTRTTIFHF